MTSNKKLCDVCNKSISLTNWSHHIRTNKHKKKSIPIVENDTNPIVITLPEKTKKQLESLINKAKCINQYYCEKCEKWVSKSNKSKHDQIKKHQI